MTNDTRTIITGALALYQTHGWVQHRYAVTSEGNRCTMTAPEASRLCLAAAVYRAWYSHQLGVASLRRAYKLIANRIPDRFGHDQPQALPVKGHKITNYNDSRRRTKKDIIMLLETTLGDVK